MRYRAFYNRIVQLRLFATSERLDMGFLDTLRERFGGAQDDEYYDDEYYEDDEYGEGNAGQPHVRETGSSNRLLGNPSRPEAESRLL